MYTAVYTENAEISLNCGIYTNVLVSAAEAQRTYLYMKNYHKTVKKIITIITIKRTV